MLQLRDAAVLVTGAGRGLGWGIARAFGRAGAKVCVTDLDEEELARCARDLAADGTTHHTRRSDVADLTECATVVKTIVNRWGRLDVVVHCAIYMPLVGFEALTPEEWWRQITVGLGGLFNCAHAAWPQMTRRRRLRESAVPGGQGSQHRAQHDRSGRPHQADTHDLGRV
jgi:NAD(P)-dependent dehydrogenase (short-subunit alcohol dehydrogenase family)